MTVGQAACQLLCRFTHSTLAASCVLRVAGVRTAHSCQTKCKNRAHA